MTWHPIQRGAALLLLGVGLALPARAGLESARFIPQVVRYDATGSVELRCVPTGTVDGIVFEPSWNNEQLTVRRRPQGYYNLDLDAQDLVAALQPDDANRALAGRLVVEETTGATTVYSVFVDILTPDIPDVSVIPLNSFTQATERILNTTGTWITLERVLTQRLYSHYPDNFDFINLVYVENRFLSAFLAHVSNDVQGTGRPIHDNTAIYGSAGRLLGTPKYPQTRIFDGAHNTFHHEMGHQWINFLTVPALTPGRPHWPISSLASGVMHANSASGTGLVFDFRFEPAGPDQWQLVEDTSPNVFSDMALYLMGFLPSDEVALHFVFDDQDQSLVAGAIWQGPVTWVDGLDVVAVMGPRVPGSEATPQLLRAATILITPDGLANEDTLRLYDWFASRAELTEPAPTHFGGLKYPDNPFYPATGGRARMSTRLGKDLTVQPPYRDLGETPVASQGATGTFTLVNFGSASLSILGVVTAGDASSEFVLTMDGCSGATLAPEETCDVEVVFEPAIEGERLAHLDVQTANPADDISDVWLRGLGTVDSDGDGAHDGIDNCVLEVNPSQTDVDQDGEGDVCDLDDGLLLFTDLTGDLLNWQDELVYNKFNVYRGDLSVLIATGEYTQDPASPAADRFCMLQGAFLNDPFQPAPGQVLDYLVTGTSGPTESSLGNDSSGAPRPNAYPCP